MQNLSNSDPVKPVPVPVISFAREIDGPWRLELYGVTIARHDTRADLDTAINDLRSALNSRGAFLAKGADAVDAAVLRKMLVEMDISPSKVAQLRAEFAATIDRTAAPTGGAPSLTVRLDEIKWRVKNMLTRDLPDESVREANESLSILDAALSTTHHQSTEPDPGLHQALLEAVAYRHEAIDRETDTPYCLACGVRETWGPGVADGSIKHNLGCIVLKARANLAAGKKSQENKSTE